MRLFWIAIPVLGVMVGCQPQAPVADPVASPQTREDPTPPAAVSESTEPSTTAEPPAPAPVMKDDVPAPAPAEPPPALPEKTEDKPAEPKPAESAAKPAESPAAAAKPEKMVASAAPPKPEPVAAAAEKQEDTAEKVESKAEAAPGKVDGPWGTIMGRVVWAGGEVPKGTLDVTKDQEHCLSKGPLPAQDPIEVNPETKGVPNVMAYLVKPSKVHPSLDKSAEDRVAWVRKQIEELNNVDLGDEPDLDIALRTALAEGKLKVQGLKAPRILDQILCLYVPHALVVQEGTPLVITNPEPITHNVKIGGFGGLNDSNDNMPPNTLLVKTLKASPQPLVFGCSIHPWMRMTAMVLDHPYYAVTNEKGEFEIPLVPEGEVKFLMRGAKYIDAVKGRKGKLAGNMLTIKAGETLDLGEIKVDESYLQ